MYKVLMPVDTNDERTQAQVEAVLDLPSAATEVRVDILHVHEEIGGPGAAFGSPYVEEINENLEDIQGLPESVSRAVDWLEEAGVESYVHTVTGSPSEAILEIATEYDVDSIVVGARSRSPVGKVLFGSVTQAIILDSDVPVIVASV